MIPATFWKAAGAAVFNPATLPFSAWHKLPFSAPPWAGNASAGGSGSVSAGTVGADPTVGAALNGKNTIAFNGAEALVESVNVSTLFSAGAGTFFCLFNATSIPTGSGVDYQDGTFLQDAGNQDQTFGLTTTGLSASILNTAGSAYVRLNVAFSATSSWHLFQAKWDGTNLRARVDSGAWSSTPAGNTGFAGSAAPRIGMSGYTNNFTGLMAEQACAASTISDTDCDNYKSYVNSVYSLAL